ncbi:unnamed protein product [Schistosoma rodhaini]|uniref:SH3 domain-containing protein n=1 Tax=Schistosoma rodhaini TaxID=6188 RepID=A0AA85G3H0_9TREM|nr:unnamed protein product [Schistosoma rodhaini]CAH8596058.1 unnamed protein product [Schistosoma rodhaini]
MIDLNTNGQALCSAVNCVLDGKWSWVIFGYMGLTHTLDVKDQGHDLDQFLNNFSSGKVLYGFIRVEVVTPAKFVLIVWQGEASSESFKLACPRHVDCVKRLCRTVHVTINARSESNLDWSEIVTKVQNLTGSVSHTQPTNSNNTDDEFVPTGSVYVRANPNKDIPKGCVSRSIWQSQQEKQNDSSKLRSPVKKPVGFVRPICEPETNNNNNNVHSENQSQNIMKQVPPDEVTNTIKNRIKALESKLPSNETALNYRKVDPRVEIMLAKQLSLSVNNDEDEEDTNHVGTCYKKQDPRAEILAARACKQPQESVFNNSEPVGANYKQSDVQSEIRSIKAANNSNTLSSTNEKSDINNNSNSRDQLSYQNGYHHQSSLQQSQQQTTSPPFSLSPIADISNNQRNSNIEQQLNNGNNNIYHQNSVSPQNSMYKLASSCIDSSPNTEVHNKRNSNLKAVCLYDYNANEDDELSFRAKEHIFDIEQIDEGWWLGRNADGQVGLFPANYVKLMM